LTKDRAAVNLWLKDGAPSTALRKWFGHDRAKWNQFQGRYRKELGEKKDAIELLKQKAKEHTVTLGYGAWLNRGALILDRRCSRPHHTGLWRPACLRRGNANAAMDRSKFLSHRGATATVVKPNS
jgi:hypothetical protein